MKPKIKTMYKLFIICLFFFVVHTAKAATHRDSINISHYSLYLDMTGAVNGKIVGEAHLAVHLKYATNSLSLDLYKLTTDSVKVNNELVSFSYSDTAINVNLGAIVEPGNLQVTVYYQGFPQKDSQWGGFFSDGTFAYNIGVGMGSYPHGIGRFWYPCNDSFTDRATYDYYIKTRSGNSAVASGELISATAEGDASIYHWRLINTIPTYLSSVAVGPFIKIADNYQGIEENIPIEIYCAKSDSSATVATFLSLKETLSAFEQSFGPYKWQRVGYVVVPFNSGAMEHATNIAFPQNNIGSSTGAKTLAAHELAHHWFGNLVTCSTSQDMWLNEGWASYCEVVFKEHVYGSESGKKHVLNNQLSVIKTAHLRDGGYYAVNNLHPEITYGSTAYDKGALVTHCLRGYLGDELFFSGIKDFLEQNEYTSISSEYLEQELSKITNVELNDFFNNWVYQPGFPHYSVGYFTNEKNGDRYATKVQLQQKLKARNNFSSDNRIMLAFIDANYEQLDTVVSFSNEREEFNFDLPIEPVAVFTDIHNMVLDASTDNTQVLKETGFTNFTNCEFKTQTHSISDSALIRVQYNFVEADDFIEPVEGVIVSNYHYWRVDGIFPEGFDVDGKFSYNFSQNTNPDSDYIIGENDTVVLLYRSDNRSNWIVKAKGPKASISGGYIWARGLNKGEYAIAYWDGETPVSISSNCTQSTSVILYPNPTKGNFRIATKEAFTGTISIFNALGDTVFKADFINEQSIELSSQNLQGGLFFVKLNGNINSIIKGVKE